MRMKYRLTQTTLVLLAFLAIAAWRLEVAHARGKGIVALATAGYQVTFGDAERSVEFTARRDSANKSRGEGHLFNHETGTKIHFTIECLNVVGTMATISGVINHTDTDAVPEGSGIWLRVIDNGEGPDSPPDLASPLLVIFGSSVACTTTLADATNPIEHGDIQVH
jgi:hypothetical protein